MWHAKSVMSILGHKIHMGDKLTPGIVKYCHFPVDFHFSLANTRLVTQDRQVNTAYPAKPFFGGNSIRMANNDKKIVANGLLYVY